MFTRYLLLLAIVCLPLLSRAQDSLRVLRANSKVVDIQDGNKFLKGGWIAGPSETFDVFNASRSSEGKRVTFTTDIDSLSFDVVPGQKYDFIILLNGKSQCPTRISTMAQSARRVANEATAGPEEIPLQFRNGKLCLEGRINDSESLTLMFDTGADTTVLYPSGASKGAAIKLDIEVFNHGTGGSTIRQASDNNRLSIAGLRWDHERITLVDKQADDADGIVGFNVFEDKVVEIDYDRMVLIIHDSLPPKAAEYSKTPLPYSGTITAVEGTLANNTKRMSGMFLLDTGGTSALIINQAFASANNLVDSMKVLGTSKSRGVGDATIRNDVLLLPEFELAGFKLQNIPIHVETSSIGSQDASSPNPGGKLCMEILKRFNTIIDYPNNEIYFKPNANFDAPFEMPSRFQPKVLLVAAGACIAIVGFIVVLVRRRR